MSALPQTIQTMLDQMGGMGLNGAYCYCGGHKPSYQCPEDGVPNSTSYEKNGYIYHNCSLSFQVNGKGNRRWKIIVSYEPDDTYTVWLWEANGMKTVMKTGTGGKVLDCRRDVYCDNLAEVIERVYDEAIETHCNGFISIA